MELECIKCLTTKYKTDKLGLAWLADSLGKILDKYRSGNKNAISLLFFCGKSIKGKQIYSVFCLPENRTAISFTYF